MNIARSGERTLPAGNVTFLFTDIEGSTRLFQRLGDQYPDLLEAHTRVIAAAVEAHRGSVVKSEGDAVFAAFADASTAIEAAIDAQRSVATLPSHPGTPMPVRMGLHTGIAYPRR